MQLMARSGVSLARRLMSLQARSCGESDLAGITNHVHPSDLMRKLAWRVPNVARLFTVKGGWAPYDRQIAEDRLAHTKARNRSDRQPLWTNTGCGDPNRPSGLPL